MSSERTDQGPGQTVPGAAVAGPDAKEHDRAELGPSADGVVQPAEVPGWRRFLPWVFGIIVLAALVLVVLHIGEIERFAALARRARPEWLVLACLAQAGTYACAAGVWHRALYRAGCPQRLATLIPLGIAKLFTDQAVPSGGIGGTVLVIRGLARRRIPGQTAMAALLVGLISFYSAYLTVALLSLGVLWLHHQANPALLAVAAIFSAVAVAIPAVVLWARRWATRAMPRWLSRSPGLKTLLDAVAQAPTDLLRSPRLLAETVALQLAVFFLDSLTLWLAFKAVGVTVDFWIVFVSFVMASVAATSR